MTSTDPKVFERILFWIAYVLGSLTLIFAWLLAQVPRPHHGANFTLDYICWSLAASLLLISLIAARRAWKIGNPFTWSTSASFLQLIVGAAWVELAFSLYGLISFAA
jgi:hypothetical protein